MPRFPTTALLLATLGLAACGKPDRVEITQSRARFTSEPAPKLDVPYALAFPTADQFRWITPEGWKVLPAAQFRDANLAFGPNGEGECYVSILGASSEEGNINRWRAQMNLSPLPEAEIEALPKKNIFGREAKFVDFSGTYAGAGGAAPKENYRLLGVVRSERDATITVKMTGPAELVAANAANFDAFLDSLMLTPSLPR